MFYVLAARPSMGKTAMAGDLGGHLALEGASVDFYSIESGLYEIYERVALAVGSDTLVDNMRFRVDDNSYVTPTYIEETSAPVSPNLIVIDYIQLMTPDNGRTGNDQRDVAEISRGLKRVAKTLNTSVLGIAQLNRALEYREDKRPILSDLRDSGQIEQDGDVVLFLYRPDMYRTIKRHDGLTELEIAKQKRGPAGRTVYLTFNEERYCFEDNEG